MQTGNVASDSNMLTGSRLSASPAKTELDLALAPFIPPNFTNRSAPRCDGTRAADEGVGGGHGSGEGGGEGRSGIVN